jgi:lipoprotein-anchoring transpeptidase ErfK/SrfK
MKTIRIAACLTVTIAAGCSSNPPQDLPPEAAIVPVHQDSAQRGESFVALPEPEPEDAEQAPDRRNEDIDAQPQATTPAGGKTPREQYSFLSTLPEAESRALQFYLSTQTFDYTENGDLVVSGPIASGKARSPTPTGKFSVLSKQKDKESSKYDNEIGTPAWMPYSMQFYGNYFVHEGWLPGQPASHGCIRMGHNHAKLLFERMKIGDPVTVSK